MSDAGKGAGGRSRITRILLALATLSLAAAAILAYARTQRLAHAAARAQQRFALARRWPSETRSLSSQPGGDLACDVFAEAVLKDVQSPFPANEKDEQKRRAWIEAASLRDEELRAARDLILEAITERPGWPDHWVLLGRVVKLQSRLPGQAELRKRPELWATPLELAASRAPGLDSAWTELASGYLEDWPRLSSAMRASAPSVLKRAFLDADFVSRDFLLAVAALGRQAAEDCLANRSSILLAAARACARAGDAPAADALLVRRDAAENAERLLDLQRIRERYRLGDADGLRAACLAWVSLHPARDLDDETGRRQEAEILTLWPTDRAGTWGSDPRTNLVRFFLNGRARDVASATLLRAAESLSGVPAPVVARIKLLGGDVDGAEKLARGSQEADISGWTPYFIDLARLNLSQGRPGEARRALDRLAPGARGECDALLIRRDVGRALRDDQELARVDRALEPFQIAAASSEPPEDSEATLSLCLDPEHIAGRSLRVYLEMAAPSVLVYGWNGSKTGRIALPEGSTVLNLPLRGLAGRQDLSIGSLEGSSGGLIRVTSSIGEPSS